MVVCIATIHKKDFKIITVSTPAVSSFEPIAYKLPGPTPLITAVIYCPPKPNPDFLIMNLCDLLNKLSAISQSILLLGDFNIHIDNPSCTQATEFLDILLQLYTTHPLPQSLPWPHPGFGLLHWSPCITTIMP